MDVQSPFYPFGMTKMRFYCGKSEEKRFWVSVIQKKVVTLRPENKKKTYGANKI